MEDGRNARTDLPRPPRRIPAGAGSLTQLEAPSRLSAPQPPPRRPWIFGRILAGFIVLLVIVATGNHFLLDAAVGAAVAGAAFLVARLLVSPMGSRVSVA